MNSELFPSPPHSFERLLQNACCGLPQLGNGTPGPRRGAWQLLGIVHFYAGFLLWHGHLPCVPLLLSVGRHPSRVRLLRALRPSICRKLLFCEQLFFCSAARFASGFAVLSAQTQGIFLKSESQITLRSVRFGRGKIEFRLFLQTVFCIFECKKRLLRPKKTVISS